MENPHTNHQHKQNGRKDDQSQSSGSKVNQTFAEWEARWEKNKHRYILPKDALCGIFWIGVRL
jgi:hypothetical protein